MSQYIYTTLSERICTIQIDRPDKKNALNLSMYTEITEQLLKADASPNIRVILITGTKDCFTSGNDLQDFLSQPPTLNESNPILQFLLTISQIKKPIIAAVKGDAIGIGTTMLLHCDLVYASTSTTFCMPFVNLALCAEAASSLLIPKYAGYAKAAEWLLLGTPFDAHAAKEGGLLSQVLPDDQLMESAMTAAQKMVMQPPEAVKVTKALMKNDLNITVQETILKEAKEFATRLKSDEAKEAMSAFMEKRKPDFSKFE